jgi:hypothetical protein
MMSLLFALHHVAAQRGDGLHPDLIRLLRRSETDAAMIQRKPNRAAEPALDDTQDRRAVETGSE